MTNTGCSLNSVRRTKSSQFPFTHRVPCKASPYFVFLPKASSTVGASLSIRASGYAAAKAHQVYTDQRFLDLAQDAWKTANEYTISPEQAGSNSIPGKNIMLASSCRSGPSASSSKHKLPNLMQLSASIAGGTFYVSHNPANLSIIKFVSAYPSIR
jgi:hypothetical protein